MCTTVCKEPKLHQVKPEFLYCEVCRRYSVLWWLVCLKVYVCADCSAYRFPNSVGTPAFTLPLAS